MQGFLLCSLAAFLALLLDNATPGISFNTDILNGLLEPEHPPKFLKAAQAANKYENAPENNEDATESKNDPIRYLDVTSECLVPHNKKRTAAGLKPLDRMETAVTKAKTQALKIQQANCSEDSIKSSTFINTGDVDSVSPSCRLMTEKWYKEYETLNGQYPTPQVWKNKAPHFAQMMWHKLSGIGCGKTSGCTRNGKDIIIFVCAYDPDGNINEAPFTEDVWQQILNPGSGSNGSGDSSSGSGSSGSGSGGGGSGSGSGSGSGGSGSGGASTNGACSFNSATALAAFSAGLAFMML